MTKTAASAQYEDVNASDRPPGSGPDASFDATYEAELDYVWRTLGRLGVAPADLADAAHDVFVVVYRRWHDLDPARPIRPWLFGVARRVAAARRRKLRELPLDAPPPSAREHDERAADRDLLWRALAELDDARREVIVLHDVEGYTGADIASMLDIPVNTVHSRLRLARADLLAAVRRLRGAP